MIAGLYQLWKQLVRDGKTNLSFLDWKDIYMKKLERKKAGYKNKKPKLRGLKKWQK